MAYASNIYRRGLTLGLTLAEIFILLLFLLLLILLALKFQSDSEIEQIKSRLEEVTQERDEIIAKLPKYIQELKRTNESLKKAVADAHKENAISIALLETAKKDLSQMREKLKATANERSGSKALLTKIDALQQENKRLKNQVYVTSKGVDPPCWYAVVTRKDKRHEKPHFLLDIAVHDEHLSVRINKTIPLPGRADDERGPASTSYHEEYEKLPLDALPLTAVKKISLGEFEEISAPIRGMGKNGKIREYACVFYAKVWDFTSPTAKKRWQYARKKIENYFYPLHITRDPW